MNWTGQKVEDGVVQGEQADVPNRDQCRLVPSTAKHSAQRLRDVVNDDIAHINLQR